MFIGRRLRYDGVVPIFAMEADRLSGDIAPLILKIGSSWMWVVRLPWPLHGHRKISGFIELEAWWALELAWMFWRKVSSLALSKI
jgi:hypothetical protein